MAKKHQTAIPLPEEDETEVFIPTVVEDIPSEIEKNLESNALTVHSITEQQLKLIEDTYGKYTIDGDAKRYKEAKAVKNKLVKVRTSTEKKRKALNKWFTDKVNEFAANLTNRTTKVENHLSSEVLNYEQAEEKRRRERIEYVEQRLIESGFERKEALFQCGQDHVFNIELEAITDERLNELCIRAQDFRTNEATAAAEAARRAAPVYLHQPEANELLQMNRGEYELEKEALDGNGVIEITKERYDEIKAAKLAAFRRPAPTPPTPAPTIENPPITNQGSDTSVGGQPVYHGRVNKSNEGFFEKTFAAPPVEAPAPNEEHEPAPSSWGEQWTHQQDENVTALRDYSEAFMQGYEAMRQQVVTAMRTQSVSRNRAQWAEYFESLTPDTRV